MHKLHADLPIETLGGHKITVSDSEQTITIMHSDGLSSITLEAEGVIKFESKTGDDMFFNGTPLSDIMK